MIEDSVVEILKEKEKNKAFKDSDVVNSGTRKYRATFAKLISLDDLDKLEIDSVTAKALVNKDKVIPKISPTEQIDKGVSAGTLYLKIKGREFVGKNPPNTPEARKLYIGLLTWWYDLIIDTVSQKEFWNANELFTFAKTEFKGGGKVPCGCDH